MQYLAFIKEYTKDSGMDTRKYIFVNGVMKVNPAFQNPQGTPALPPSSSQSLAIVSSTQDIMAASEAQYHATGREMQISDATTASMEIMQDSYYLNQFKSPTQIDGGQLLDGLSNIFARYEVPVGLINKLLALTEYALNFIVDDSGSMINDTDALVNQASDQMKQLIDPYGQRANSYKKVMTRWEEAQDRLHILVDMLAYIPTSPITIRFLNRNDKIILDHTGKSIEQFAQEAHEKIKQHFAKGPSGGTPIYGTLRESFKPTTTPTMHYLLTDGEPSDASIEEVKDLILRRPNPKNSPLTFLSCTNENAKWMKEIEGDAPFTAELDDYISERQEVVDEQGEVFPFSRGFWLLCQLVAAINPYDLDALDESTPFTKKTLDDLMGRRLTQEEYLHYFTHNPNAHKFMHLRDQFAREDVLAYQVLGKPDPMLSLTGVQPMQSQTLSSVHYPNVYASSQQNPASFYQGMQQGQGLPYQPSQPTPPSFYNGQQQMQFQQLSNPSLARSGMFANSGQMQPSAPPLQKQQSKHRWW